MSNRWSKVSTKPKGLDIEQAIIDKLNTGSNAYIEEIKHTTLGILLTSLCDQILKNKESISPTTNIIIHGGVSGLLESTTTRSSVLLDANVTRNFPAILKQFSHVLECWKESSFGFRDDAMTKFFECISNKPLDITVFKANLSKDLEYFSERMRLPKSDLPAPRRLLPLSSKIRMRPHVMLPKSRVRSMMP